MRTVITLFSSWPHAGSSLNFSSDSPPLNPSKCPRQGLHPQRAVHLQFTGPHGSFCKQGPFSLV